ncbi:D-allulose 6-phosphate 3-epimerase [Zongyangia hominis]|uniref:Ribulose-phosphate 3-epimerase n=1 Tax=Zongyangia hominis TaxID=2763677 RepID=A0A926EDF8_9FIRM|nr:D-allulose 6-phosphate 3-epimerase [Zongyangia hominis]MBC8570174.1 ribulose-phosphate 3-epimerase [Zongyangia hominis]
MKFSPSLMCMSFLDVRRGIQAMNDKADFYHIDIMDGHFVPNLAMSPAQVAEISAITDVPLDCHLMVDNPQNYIDILAKAGAGYICPQAETLSGQAFRLISRIKEAGCKVGVVINPETPLGFIQHYIHLIDKLTIMTVDPGFAGQPFIWEMIDKIKKAKKLKEEYGYSYLIEVDGACNEATYKALTQAGAEVMILGSSGLFDLDEDLTVAWEKMESAYARAIE